MSGYNPLPAPKKGRAGKIAAIVFLAVAVLCVSGIVAAAVGLKDQVDKDVAQWVEPTPSASVRPSPGGVVPKKTTPKKTVTGSSLPGTFGGGDFTAGKHIQAGTYRTEGASGSGEFSICTYTVKGVDGQYIDGGVSNPREPLSATLKTGQSIETQGCETWRLEG